MKVEIVGRPENYIYPDNYFFDTNYHLNGEGRYKRTMKLIKDLKPYLVFLSNV